MDKLDRETNPMGETVDITSEVESLNLFNQERPYNPWDHKNVIEP